MLANAYRDFGLSHFDYSAVVLMSCTEKDKAEMSHFQNRCLKSIGIEATASKHNISPILTHINVACQRIFDRIISNNTHPITTSLSFNERAQKYLAPRARTFT